MYGHPLDRLVNDSSLIMLEAMVPFVDYQYKRPLILFIKYRELMCILNNLNDTGFVASCGFDCHPKSQEEMLEGICKLMPGNMYEEYNRMKSMMSAMNMMSVMETMNAPNDTNSMSDINDTNYTNLANGMTATDSTSLYESVLNILDEDSASQER